MSTLLKHITLTWNCLSSQCFPGIAKSRSIPWRTSRNIEVVIVISQELRNCPSKLSEQWATNKVKSMRGWLPARRFLFARAKKVYLLLSEAAQKDFLLIGKISKTTTRLSPGEETHLTHSGTLAGWFHSFSSLFNGSLGSDRVVHTTEV